MVVSFGISFMNKIHSFCWILKRRKLVSLIQHTLKQKLIHIKIRAKCCGYASIGDRSIPKTCSILLGVNIGCRESMITNIKQQHQCITISILFLLSVQVNTSKIKFIYISNTNIFIELVNCIIIISHFKFYN